LYCLAKHLESDNRKAGLYLSVTRKFRLLVKRRVAGFLSKLSKRNQDSIEKTDIYAESESDQEFWDSRYSIGGTSGSGSIGTHREWKWNQISEYVDITKKEIIDVGCGDLSFWESRTCKSYTGIDFSETIIRQNQQSRPYWTFMIGNASDTLDLSGQVVFCFDMLFHVMDDSEYELILQNLAKWTTEWLIVYTWWQSPFGEKNTDYQYQIFRPLLDSLYLLEPLDFVAEHRHTDIGAMYVFKKM
jgi:hypothetical protein